MSSRVVALWLLAVGLIGAVIWREQARVAQYDPRLATGDDGIVMLTAEWCGYCRKQEQLFERAGVRYTALDVDSEAGGLAFRAVRGRAVPITVVGQKLIRGYDLPGLRDALRPLGYSLP